MNAAHMHPTLVKSGGCHSTSSPEIQCVAVIMIRQATIGSYNISVKQPHGLEVITDYGLAFINTYQNERTCLNHAFKSYPDEKRQQAYAVQRWSATVERRTPTVLPDLRDELGSNDSHWTLERSQVKTYLLLQGIGHV